MQPPLPDTEKVSYHVPRDILIRIWWRRTTLRPRRLILTALLLLSSLACFLMWLGMEYVGLALLLFSIFIPIAQYRVLAKAVDQNRMLTDPKTLEFGSSKLVLTGPNWKSEMPWTRFIGFSEDATYFYLHLSENGIASVIPKNAFSSAQQDRFRQYAQPRTT